MAGRTKSTGHGPRAQRDGHDVVTAPPAATSSATPTRSARGASTGMPSRRVKPPAAKAKVASGAKLSRKVYERELAVLDIELNRLQEWVRHAGLRIVVLFEGRDAAGKGGTIKRSRPASTRASARRGARHAVRSREDPVVLPALRRRICRRPARSSCSTAAGTTAPASSGSWASAARRSTRSSSEPRRSSSACSSASGIILVKYWFSVSDDEQERRFQERIDDPRSAGSSARWTCSPGRAGSTTREPRTRCSSTPTPRPPPGGSSTPTTSAGRGSTASATC